MRPWLLPLSALTGSVVLLASAWPTLWTTVDDAWISARYAANLAAGNGLVYNAGEAVEGFSNPLWTAMLGLWLAVGGEPATGMVYGGLAHALLLPPACLWLAWVVGGRRDGIALAGVPLAVAVSPQVAVVATNGLETSQWLLALVIALAASLQATGRARFAAGALLGGLAWVRPEGLGVAAVVAALDLVAHRRADAAKDRWALTLGALAPLLLLIAWRWGSYGHLTPNTWAAKNDARDSADMWTLNKRYLAHDGVTWPLVSAVLAATALVPPWTRERAIPAAVGGLLLVAALQVELWMPGARLLTPLWLLTCSSVAAVAVAGPERWRSALAVAAMLGALAPRLPPAPRGIVNYDLRNSVMPDNDASKAARWLGERAPAGSTLAVRDAGVVAFYVGVHVRVAELHPSALTVPHPEGARTTIDAVLQGPPELIVTTVQREDAPRTRYGLDREALALGRYRFLGRVEQHYHRYYDVWVRSDLDLGDLPEDLLVPLPREPR